LPVAELPITSAALRNGGAHAHSQHNCLYLSGGGAIITSGPDQLAEAAIYSFLDMLLVIAFDVYTCQSGGLAFEP
jgi:hypothetical protein